VPSGGGGISYPLLAPDGTAAAPSYSFSGDPNTGIYHPVSADTIAFSAAGSVAATLSATVLALSSNSSRIDFGVVGGSLSFPGVTGLRIDDSDTGTGLTFSQGLFTFDHTITVPNADGTMTLNTATQTLTNKTLTSPVSTNARVNTGVTNGSGMQHKRGASCTTGSLINATCDTTITWPIAFADTNYTAIATLDSPSGGLVFILSTKNKTTTTIDVTLVTLTAAASSGTINLIAFHD
jgi:hypothetical protein